MSYKIIGGMFGLEITLEPHWKESALPRFFSKQHVKLATARSAFRLLEAYHRPKSVWLPSYLCSAVRDAFCEARIHFYPVGRNLQIGSTEWLNDLVPNDMVVFIDYFGFSLWRDWGAQVRERGAWIVEDACHAMVNGAWCEHSHYVVFSPRKFVGVPDGGILLSQGGSWLPEGKLPNPPSDWWIDSVTALVLRAEFDRNCGDRRWFELFRKCESAAPFEPARMSELSIGLLSRCINFEEISSRRRTNYLQLASCLPDLALFPELPAEVVPLGFPIQLADRDRVRHSLFEAQIYPAVHWPLKGVVPNEFAESHQLSQEIMTLPCDQRLRCDDIEIMSTHVRRAS